MHRDVRYDITEQLRFVCAAVQRVSVPSLINSDGQVCTDLQAISTLKFDDPTASMLHGIVVRHMIAAEHMGPGCRAEFIRSLLGALAAHDRGDTPCVSKSDTGSVQVTRMAQSAAAVDLQWLIARSGHFDVVNDAVHMAGPTGKIIIERSASSRCSVELIDGYTFRNVAFVWKGTKLLSPLVVCIDGFIESVAEVNLLLTELAESRDRCLLFVRGMADEVKHTLRTNYVTGRLGVFPIIVPFELEGINTLNDVSIVCGCDLVTSIKGDLISSVGLHSMSRISSATCSNNTVMLVNSSTHRAVEQQRMTLTERVRTGDGTTSKMLEQRIRSLVPRTVVIRLPNDNEFVRTAQAIDNTLRAVNTLVRYGVVGQGTERELAALRVAIDANVARCVADITNLGAALVTS